MADSIDQMVLRIRADPAPVVMVDTSSILDVVRSPIRPLRGDILVAARTLTAKALSSPRHVWLVITQQVLQEWNDNSGNVVGEVAATIRNTEEMINRLVAAAKEIAPTERPEGVALQRLGLDNLLLGRAGSLIDASAVLADDHDCNQKAVIRMRQGIPPASSGGKEFKDCLIIEHFLAAGAALRSGGLTETMLFVSSNKNDYGEPPGAAPLNGEFEAIGLDFVADLAWATSRL